MHTMQMGRCLSRCPSQQRLAKSKLRCAKSPMLLDCAALAPAPQETPAVIDSLTALDVDALTPRQALEALYALKDQLPEGSP